MNCLATAELFVGKIYHDLTNVTAGNEGYGPVSLMYLASYVFVSLLVAGVVVRAIVKSLKKVN